MPTEPGSDDAVVVVPISISKENEAMPEITPMELLQLESIGNIQNANTSARNAATLASNILQGYMSQAFGEVGVVEGRAVSGVNATPIAGPATQAAG